jgi:hypothetical protein
MVAAGTRLGSYEIVAPLGDASDEERRVSNSEDATVPTAMSPEGGEMLVRAVLPPTTMSWRPCSPLAVDGSPTSRMSRAAARSTSGPGAGPDAGRSRTKAAFEIARDGRMLVTGNPDASASPGRLNVVVNWFDEIRAS